MLEVLIILFLAGALFLLLRHYPEAKQVNFSLSKFNFDKFTDFLKSKKGQKRLLLTSIQPDIAAHIENNVPSMASEFQARVSKVFVEKNPLLLTSLYKAEEAYLANDLREAESQAIEAITKDKRCGEAYIMMGKIAFYRGEFEDAKESYKAALKCNKNLAEAYYGLGKAEAKEDNFTKAIDHLEKSIALEKGNADWYFELGKCYVGVRQYAKAAKVLKKATSIDIDNKDYKTLAAEAEEKQRTHSIYSRLR